MRPTEKIKLHRGISNSMLSMMSYSRKMRIKRHKPKEAPRGYGIFSWIDSVRNKRFCKNKLRFLMRFE